MSTEHHPRSCTRRNFLAGVGLGTLGGAAAGLLARPWLFPVSGTSSPTPGPAVALNNAPLTMPGPFPGRVIEVHHPGALGAAKVEGYTERNRPAVKAMIERGMKELVGSDDAVEAWRRLFAPGDRVGIKVVPVGKPDSISSYEVVSEVIEGLRSAKVRLEDILVFERYRNEFVGCGYDKKLPDGVYWECSASRYDDLQVEIAGHMPDESSEHVAGYDPDVFREVMYCDPHHDPSDDRRFRSHLSVIVSRRIDKLITIPVLKDHRSSGVTLALKNLSHGLVNNVARSHLILHKGDSAREPGGTLNQCGTFIPTMASLPAVRQKAVLHILDGLVGTWEGGPKLDNKTFATWQYKSLLFATDPVALDHIGWEIIDRKRAAEGWPGVAAMGLDASTGVGKIDGKPYPEELHIRQPQHIPLAETLGMGVFKRNMIVHKQIEVS
jgi:Domain of unknown function (DUF362)